MRQSISMCYDTNMKNLWKIILALGLALIIVGVLAIQHFFPALPSDNLTLGACVEDSQVNRVYKIIHLHNRYSVKNDTTKGEILKIGSEVNDVYKVGNIIDLSSNAFLKEVPCPELSH